MATAGVKRSFAALDSGGTGNGSGSGSNGGDAPSSPHLNGNSNGSSKAARVDGSQTPRPRQSVETDHRPSRHTHAISSAASSNWSSYPGTESPSIAIGLSREPTPVASTTTTPQHGGVQHRTNGALPAFPADASIVLIGIRGAGKSTLAIIASTAMKRSVIDCERVFQSIVGTTSWAYKRDHGAADCHRKQAEVLRDVLAANARQCLIVCSWTDRGVQVLLRDFSRTHPVVLVLRDARAVGEHLRIEDDDRARSLLNASSAIFRGCSSLEFFNVTESPGAAGRDGDGDDADAQARKDALRGGHHPPAPYLTLKRAERHFLKFLSLVMPAGSIPFIESAFPLASIPTEDRRFTYALSVPLSRLLRNDVDMQDLETGADAIEIVVDCEPGQGDEAHGTDHNTTTTPGSGSNVLDAERLSDVARMVGSIRRTTVVPVVYHVVPPPGQQQADAWYMEHVLHALRLAPEYLTVDLARLGDYELSSIAAIKRRTKLIGHFTTPAAEARTWQDPVWMAQYRRARAQGCDVVRLIKPAAAIQDNFDVNRFKAQVADALGDTRGIPLIAYNSGPRGRHSACMNHVLTSVAVSPVSELITPPGAPLRPLITAKEATQALYGSFLFDPMKLYVVGAHVEYSLSPAMHNAAFRALGIPHHYSPHSTPSLRGLRSLLDDPYFAGASVGLPFKVEIIALTHSLSRHARAIGAVNTLIPVRRLNPDGSIPRDEKLFNCRNRAGPVRALYGDNTDWVGIRACIRRGLSPANAVRPSSCGLVIGAGGMARAAVYAMLQLGVQSIVIHNRTVANAEKLADHFGQLFARRDIPLLSTWSDAEARTTRFHVLRTRDEAWPEGFRKPTVIVFTIPNHAIGDVPAPNFTAPEPWFDSPTGGVLIDLGYKTLDTPILAQARARSHRGWVTQDGLDLLPEQGFAQFELFTGRRAPRRLMRENALRAYTDEKGRSNLAQLQPRLNDITEQEP
ncbi:quinate repressor [Plectosphaerella plurivora]|uniref:Quinate repressor n=1 Tax=Plectosphaerella plurivora TaxID=936078 RepID=A0A9P9A4I6_9PEZI|nr:quinate repressor [Plectosphaerella plurivora]